MAAVLGASGCSGEPGQETASRPSDSPTPLPSPPASRAPATPSTAPGVPEPGSLQQPATTAGPLTGASFPSPTRLGPGWRYAVDPGDAEEGYAGNGTPTLARSPREVVATAVPFGCARPAVMATPAHALEVDYTLRGARVIAVRGAFTSTGEAAAFFTARERNLRACVGRDAGAALGRLVARLDSPAPGALASDRTPDSDPWRELAVLDGDSVVLLAIAGTNPLDAAATRRVVRLLRADPSPRPTEGPRS